MIEQGTPEWNLLRLGKLTASRVADMLATVKTSESASRKNLRADLIVERLTKQKTEYYTNSAMEWGTQTEPKARSAYEVNTGQFVDQIAFVDHPTIPMFGCSPDGLVGNDGLIEIKCPNTATHLEYYDTKEPPKKYIIQMQTQLCVTGRTWCDFVSFDPRLPKPLDLLILRVSRDETMIKKIQDEAVKFLAEIDQKVNELLEKIK